MESMDFVIELTDKLKKQNIDFFLVTVRENEEKKRGDVFYSFRDEESVAAVMAMIDKVGEIQKEEHEEQNSKPKTKRTKKPDGE